MAFQQLLQHMLDLNQGFRKNDLLEDLASFQILLYALGQVHLGANLHANTFISFLQLYALQDSPSCFFGAEAEIVPLDMRQIFGEGGAFIFTQLTDDVSLSGRGHRRVFDTVDPLSHHITLSHPLHQKMEAWGMSMDDGVSAYSLADTRAAFHQLGYSE